MLELFDALRARRWVRWIAIGAVAYVVIVSIVGIVASLSTESDEPSYSGPDSQYICGKIHEIFEDAQRMTDVEIREALIEIYEPFINSGNQDMRDGAALLLQATMSSSRDGLLLTLGGMEQTCITNSGK